MWDILRCVLQNKLFINLLERIGIQNKCALDSSKLPNMWAPLYVFDSLTIMFQSVDYVAEIDVLTRL